MYCSQLIMYTRLPFEGLKYVYNTYIRKLCLVCPQYVLLACMELIVVSHVPAAAVERDAT